MQIKKTAAVKHLLRWLKKNKISLYALAKMTHTHYTTIWKLAQGNHPPSLETAIKIEEITEGFVPCYSWLIYEDSPPSIKPKNKTNDKCCKENDKKAKKSSRKLIPQ